MRKRSGAIDSYSLDSYVKLATLSQTKESLFYSNDCILSESSGENMDLKRTTSRKSSDCAARPAARLSPASSSVKFRKNTNFDFNWSFKDKEEKKVMDELSCSRTISNFSSLSNDEVPIVANKIITKQIIVIGASQTGKKSLVYSLFGDNDEDGCCEVAKEPCFDLIVKSEDVAESEKFIYKFWIQNLSNEIYEKIIDVYYRTMNMFIFVYNVSDKQSFEKIAENYQHIKTLAKGTNLHCLLIGMHFSPKHKIEVTNEEANAFAENMNFLGFLVTNKRNSSVNKNIYEIMRNHFGVTGGVKKEEI